MINKRILSYFFLIFFSTVLFSSCSFRFQTDPHKSRILRGKFDAMSYHLLAFPHHDRSEKFPLILLLHGSHQKGAEILGQWQEESSKRHVMILAPDWIDACKTDKKKDCEDTILSLLDNLLAQYSIDKQKIFMAGISAGGGKAQNLLGKSPGKWRGLLFMSFVPSLNWFQAAERERGPALFFTYGLKDSPEPYARLKEGESFLEKRNLSVQLLVDSEAGHEYKTEWGKAVFDWISMQSGMLIPE